MQCPPTRANTCRQAAALPHLPDEILLDVCARLDPQSNRALVFSCRQLHRVGQTVGLPWPKEHLTYALARLRGQSLIAALGAPGVADVLRTRPHPTVLPPSLMQEELDGVATLVQGTVASFVSFDADAIPWRQRIVPKVVHINAALSSWVTDTEAAGKHQAITVARQLLEAQVEQSRTLRLTTTHLAQIPPCDALPHLDKLHLEGHAPASLAGIATLQGLTHLKLSCPDVRSAIELRALTQLRILDLSDKAAFFFDAASFANLHVLVLRRIDRLKVLGLGALRKLEVLDLTRTTTTHPIDLTRLRALRYRNMGQWHGQMCMTHWFRLHNLRSLQANNTALHSLDFLRGVTTLAHLNVAHTSVASIACLAEHTALQTLDVSHTQVTCIAATTALPQLHRLNTAGTPYARRPHASA